MTNVIAWPPFGITGWALDEVYPQSRSVGFIEGNPRTSAAQRGRRVSTAIISGIGPDLAGAGYVRMLNRQWEGRPKLVRVECLSSLWFLSKGGLDLQNNLIEWVADGVELLWTDGGFDMIMGDGAYATSGVPVTDDGWHSLSVTGLPPSRIVARPSELISITNKDGVTESGHVLTVVRSDASGADGKTGAAIIRTDRPEAFALEDGLVSIGHKESIVFEAVSLPRSVQGLSGDFKYTWEFKEVFEDEYSDGWTEVNPW
jgi:hypothetical protein